MQQKVTVTVRVQDVETKEEVVHREIFVLVVEQPVAGALSKVAAAVMGAAVRAA